MNEGAVAISSLEGMSDLLAAVFGKSQDDLRRHFGLVLLHRYCACGKRVAPRTQGDRCLKCIHKDTWVERICQVCGKTFPMYRHRLGINAGLYCSPKCWGKVAGKQNGFGAHPENIAKKGQPIVIILEEITTERPKHRGGVPDHDFSSDIELLGTPEAIRKGQTRRIVLRSSSSQAQNLVVSWRKQCKRHNKLGSSAVRKGPEEGQHQIWLWIVQEATPQ